MVPVLARFARLPQPLAPACLPIAARKRILIVERAHARVPIQDRAPLLWFLWCGERPDDLPRCRHAPVHPDVSQRDRDHVRMSFAQNERERVERGVHGGSGHRLRSEGHSLYSDSRRQTGHDASICLPRCPHRRGGGADRQSSVCEGSGSAPGVVSSTPGELARNSKTSSA